MTESEIGTKPAPRGVSWEEVSLTKGGHEGNVTIDDVAFAKRPDGTPVTRDQGKPIVYVLERVGMRRLQDGPALVDPGVALLLRSDDGGATFEFVTQLPGLGFPAKLRLASTPRGAQQQRIYIEAPSEDTGLRGGPLSFHGALMRSDNGGHSFTSLPGHVNDVEVDVANADVLTGVTCAGLVKSTDGGHSWANVTSEPPVADCNGSTLVRTKDPTRLYAIFGLGELGFPAHYRSDDGGISFRAIENQSEDYDQTEVLVDDLDPNHVWAWDVRGFVSSSDGAKTMFPHNRGLASTNRQGFVSYALSNLEIDDLHKPPHQEKHTLWFANGERLVRWAPANEPEGGSWKEIGRLPGAGVRFEIAGRGTAPKPFAVVRRGDGSEALLRGSFAY